MNETERKQRSRKKNMYDTQTNAEIYLIHIFTAICYAYGYNIITQCLLTLSNDTIHIIFSIFNARFSRFVFIVSFYSFHTEIVLVFCVFSCMQANDDNGDDDLCYDITCYSIICNMFHMLAASLYCTHKGHMRNGHMNRRSEKTQSQKDRVGSIYQATPFLVWHFEVCTERTHRTLSTLLFLF